MKRRAHAKSRNGCLQCKARRVKCDEGRPKCRFCSIRGDPCNYTPASGSVPLWAAHNLPLQDEASATPIASDQTELELMFVFGRHIVDDITSSDGTTDQMRRLMAPPELLQFPYLLQVVFAITCAYLACKEPPNANKYLDLATRYQNAGLRDFRAALQNPRPESCCAMFWFSALIGVLNLATSRVPGIQRVACVDTLDQISKLWRGSESLMKLSKNLLDPESYQRLFGSGISNSKTPKEGDEGEMMWALGETEKLVSERSPSASYEPTTPVSIQDHEIALRAIRELSHTLKIGRNPLQWLVDMGADFTLLLRTGHEEVRIVTVVFGVILQQYYHKNWWGNDFGKDLVDELTSGFKNQQSSACKEMMIWARRKVELTT